MWLRDYSRGEAAVVRSHLQMGDSQVGDQIAIQVENEPMLSDTFTVDVGRVLTLPTIGDVALRGVWRAELKSHLASNLQRFLRDPIINVRPLIRISIFGAVGQPGFYSVPGEALLTDVIMAAGGPTGRSVLSEVRVERGDQEFLSGRALQEAIVAGRTLDELRLRPEDRIFIPEHGGVEHTAFRNGDTLSPLGIFVAARIFEAARWRIRPAPISQLLVKHCFGYRDDPGVGRVP